MKGWIKLHRKILDNPVICKDSDHYVVWNYLLLNATHNDLDVIFKGKRYILKSGQLLTSRKSIALQFRINESKIQRILKTFENFYQIKQQTTNKNRLITICNWSIYQLDTQQDELQLKHNCNTNEHKQECKELKEYKKKNIIDNAKTLSDSSVQKINYKKIIDLFNSICTTLPRAKVTDNRKRILKAWINSEKEEINFKEFFNKVNNSEFLSGKNGKWMMCSLDWILRPSNRVKILEGNYDNKNHNMSWKERMLKRMEDKNEK